MGIFSAILTLIFAIGAFATLPVHAERLSRTVKFDVPDIHDDFCGAKIDYRICKCARHNEMCKDIGRERAQASYILNARYAAYVAGLRASFVANCLKAGGKFSQDACRYYERDKKESECLPGDFEANWKKYSDFDDRIPENERSFEAKGFAETWEKFRKNAEELYLLERNMELDRLMRTDLKEIKKALVANLKLNLIKAELRLMWVTYDAIAGAVAPGKNTLMPGDAKFLQEGIAQGGVDLGRSYAKLFTEADLTTHIGVFAKLLREFTPESSRFAINKDTVAGKFKSVGLTGGIAALENLANPHGAIEAAKEMFQDATKQTIAASADITEEEVEILRNQHLRNKAIDDALQESYRQNRERRLKAESLRNANEALKAEAALWEMKERDRVKNELVDACTK